MENARIGTNTGKRGVRGLRDEARYPSGLSGRAWAGLGVAQKSREKIKAVMFTDILEIRQLLRAMGTG